MPITVTTVPVAAFSASPTTINPGDAVTYADASANATSWSWTFPGGNPATSILKNPVVNYNNIGVYDVTLIAKDTCGTSTLTKTGYITVNSPIVSRAIDTTFTAPACVTQITVQVWGAGGAGGSGTTAQARGGGGGGAYASQVVTVVPGVTYNYHIGAGGVPTVSATAPSVASDSYFGNTAVGNSAGSTVLAKAGGFGGTGVGGAGGAAGLSIGTTVFSGGAGSINSGSNGGAGGGSAGSGSIGGNGSGTTGGTAGSAIAPLLGGAVGGFGGIAASGTNGFVPGGGGGGKGTGGAISGSGANGRVIITYATVPTVNLTGFSITAAPACSGTTSTVSVTSPNLPNATYSITYRLTGANITTADTTATITMAGGTGSFITRILPNSGSTTITVRYVDCTGICTGNV